MYVVEGGVNEASLTPTILIYIHVTKYLFYLQW